MKTTFKQHKVVLLAFCTLLLLVILDFSPMFYSRIFGNGGTFVEYYKFDISGDSLLKVLQDELTKKDKNFSVEIIDQRQTGYSYVQVFSHKYQQYVHLWVKTNQEFDSGTVIVFYAFSDSPDFRNCKRINRDYDYISRKFIINKFERLIIERLQSRLAT